MIKKAKEIVKDLRTNYINFDDSDKKLATISQALDQAEKNDKVLEIIKRCDVNIQGLKKAIKSHYDFEYEDYLRCWNIETDYNIQHNIPDFKYSFFKLTEEEFNLIKEWLEK